MLNRFMQTHSRRWIRKTRSVGLSLLEVVLALAILAVATAYLASTMEQATTNGLKSQKLTQAELVAESVVNQIIAGVIPSDPVSWTPFSNSRGPTEWVYQIQQVPTELESMVGFQVAVQQTGTEQGVVPARADLFANRWIIDPELQLDVPPEDEGYGDEGYGSEGSGGSTAGGGGTSSTGGAQATGGGAALGGAGGGFGPGGPGGGGGRGGAGGGRGGAGGGGRGDAGGGGGRGGGGGPGGGGGGPGGGRGGRG